MYYNDEKNNLFYIIILLLCLVTSIQIMLKKNIVEDPIVTTSFKNDFKGSSKFVNVGISQKRVKLIIDTPSNVGLGVYLNGEKVYNNISGEVVIDVSHGDVCSFENAGEANVSVYMCDDEFRFSNVDGVCYSLITVEACQRADFYIRAEK